MAHLLPIKGGEIGFEVKGVNEFFAQPVDRRKVRKIVLDPLKES